MTKLVRTLFILLLTITLGAAVNAATFVVNTTNDTVDATPGDGICADAVAACSLRAAISEANAFAGDDIITLPAGTYTQSLVAANDDLNAGGDWDITSNITINGAGAATTILQANAAPNVATERVLNVRTGTTILNGVTVRHGRFSGTMLVSTRGAGIENVGTLTINNSIVTLNSINSTSGNSIGAGIHNAGPALTLTNTQVTANSNVRAVGGSAFGGGISSIVATTIVITGSSVSGNSATTQATVGAFGFGSGLYLENLFNVTATNSSFNNNTGTGVLTGGTNGTGVRALSNIGAAVFNATNCTFNNNTGTGGTAHQGQGIQFFSTAAAASITAVLDRVTLNGNAGSTLGIGINATATAGNMNLTVRNTTISGNTGGTTGGGMAISNSGAGAGTVNFLNSTISGNIVSGNGGGLSVEQPGAGVITANMNFTTIANNRANNDNAGTEGGGGLFRGGASVVNLKNSIVADNTLGTGGAGPDILGAITSQDYNHIEDTTGATIGGTTTNNTTGDPQLGALASNGGPTQTHLPSGTSPVLNTIPNGTNDCGTPVNTDQRGGTRPGGAGCEKGSVEIAIAAGPFNIDGRVLTTDGRGIRNTLVTLSGGGLPQPLVIQTGMFGTFGFRNVPAGTYTLSVAAKRFTFAMPSRVINLNADAANENFVAEPGFGVKPAEPEKEQ